MCEKMSSPWSIEKDRNDACMNKALYMYRLEDDGIKIRRKENLNRLMYRVTKQLI